MSDEKDEVIENPDPHFEPIIHLPPVQTKTHEEDEDEMLKLRAKLYRYDSQSEPREWKERGTGDVKILRQKQLGMCRILMRRDKTLKICANHYILPQLELKPNCGSDRAWVWSTPAEFADEEPKAELLAIRFANVENAQKFKEIFDEAKQLMENRMKNVEKGDIARNDGEDATKKLNKDDRSTTEEKVTEKNGTVKDKENGITTEGKSTKATVKDEEAKSDVVEKLEKMTVKDDTKTGSGEAKFDSVNTKSD